MRRRSIAWAAAALMTAMASCAHGPGFKKVEAFPQDRALVYFYRPSAFVAGGQNYTIKLVEAELGKLQSGVYFTYLAVPGLQTFYYEGLYGYTKVDVDLAPGGTYYIRGRMKGYSMKLEQVHPIEGQVEIMECILTQ